MSVLKKEISESGINGTFNGTLMVMLNYRSHTKEVTNPVLHEEVTRKFMLHKVTGSVLSTTVIESEDFTNENLVWQFIDDVEKKLRVVLRRMAHDVKVKTIEDQLKEKGFK